MTEQGGGRASRLGSGRVVEGKRHGLTSFGIAGRAADGACDGVGFKELDQSLSGRVELLFV